MTTRQLRPKNAQVIIQIYIIDPFHIFECFIIRVVAFLRHHSGWLSLSHVFPKKATLPSVAKRGEEYVVHLCTPFYPVST
uniref:Uncharacterized protein n=1 Tax=Anguilla anguilla TaxID=7936 RepID=A0A0E9XWW4_ANGAN